MNSKRKQWQPSTIAILACLAAFSGRSAALAPERHAISEPVFDSLAANTAKQPLEHVPDINVCDKLITHTNRVKVNPVATPPFMRLYKEPGFGTKSMRITSSSAGQVNKPAGNPAQAWNINESLLMLHQYDKDGKHHVIINDGKSYKQLKQLALPTLSGEALFWSHNDPLLLFYVTEGSTGAAGQLTRYNVLTDETEIIKDFAPICQKAGFSAQNGLLTKPSYDDDLFGYRCGVSKEKSLAIGYRASTDQLKTLAVGGRTQWPTNTAPAATPSGKHFWLHNASLDENLVPMKPELDFADSAAPHSLSINANNEDVLFQSAMKKSPNNCSRNIWNGIGLVVEHDLSDGQCNSRVSQTDGYPITPQGTDMFASAYRAPKWMAMSSTGYDNLNWFKTNRSAPLLFSEIYLVNTRFLEDPEICRLAHHRSYGKQARNASYDPVLGEPNVTISPSATRVLFSSDWYDSGKVDTYVIELPSFTRIDLHGTWIDEYNYNMITEFAQAGEKLTFRRALNTQSDADTMVTTGSGTIIGNKMELSYVIKVTKHRHVEGKCLASVKENQDKVLIECQDNYFGKLRLNIMRPR